MGVGLCAAATSPRIAQRFPTNRKAITMQFTGLMHAAVRVADVERSLAFYVGKLGLKEMYRQYYENGDLWLIYLRIIDEQYLEIFPNATGDACADDKSNGLNHICLTVPSIADFIAEMKRLGIPLWRELKIGGDRNQQCWIRDPDENRIEVMEMATHSKQREAIANLRQPATP
jgi:lactoylglutathione lyase